MLLLRTGDLGVQALCLLPTLPAPSTATPFPQATPVNITARPNTYNLTCNGTLVVPKGSGLLSNDASSAGNAQLVITSSTSAVPDGLLLQPDGSFNYTPPADFGTGAARAWGPGATATSCTWAKRQEAPIACVRAPLTSGP